MEHVPATPAKECACEKRERIDVTTYGHRVVVIECEHTRTVRLKEG